MQKKYIRESFSKKITNKKKEKYHLTKIKINFWVNHFKEYLKVEIKT
jgi:hypothetical protein